MRIVSTKAAYEDIPFPISAFEFHLLAYGIGQVLQSSAIHLCIGKREPTVNDTTHISGHICLIPKSHSHVPVCNSHSQAPVCKRWQEVERQRLGNKTRTSGLHPKLTYQCYVRS